MKFHYRFLFFKQQIQQSNTTVVNFLADCIFTKVNYGN